MKIIKKFLISIIKELWPLNRSITGNGVRKTHKILSKIHKFKTIEVKSGAKCFDWTVPKEWNVREAYILDPQGKKATTFLDISLGNLRPLRIQVVGEVAQPGGYTVSPSATLFSSLY